MKKGLITKVEKKSNPCMNCYGNKITLIDEQYICLSYGCSNGFKFNDNIKVKYYKKLFYNRKYQLEKYIKKYENYESFDRMNVIILFIIL